MKYRYELDSLRGVAALTVVFSHLMFFLYEPLKREYSPIFTENTLIQLLKYSPIRILWAGHEAVILFFILSGFVLFFSIQKDKEYKFFPYLIKRFFRIYIPYLISLIVVVFCKYYFYDSDVKTSSSWINDSWSFNTNFYTIWNHIILNSSQFNSVYWSLIHEMRVSIIFPLFIALNRLVKDKITILIAILLSVVGFVCYYFFDQGNSSSIFLTMHYSSFFICGIILCKHLDYFFDLYNKISKKNNLIIPLSAITFYSYSYLFPWVGLIHNPILNDWLIALGSCLLIIFSLKNKKAIKLLNLKFMIFLGKISYSLYLYHLIVMLSLIYLIPQSGKISLAIFTILISISISVLSYYFIEIPSINFAKKIIRRIKGKKRISKKIS